MSKELNGWVKFDEETGLIVSSQSEVFDDLKTITQTAFGSDFVIEEGSDIFTFLKLLSDTLSASAGAYKKVYDSLGFINASGVTLDNAVSLAGITREGLVRSSVDITITKNEEIEDSITINDTEGIVRIQDVNGNNWYCNEEVTFSNDTSTLIRKFYASDGNIEKPYDISIKSYNGKGTNENAQPWKILTANALNKVTFQNTEDSILGQEKESDAQLKYRYYTALYGQSSATVDGLKSKLLNSSNLNLDAINSKPLNVPINTVYIYENNTNSVDAENVSPHSIWVIVDGTTSWDGKNGSTTDNDDITIANIIRNFKSLGAGTSYGKSTPVTEDKHTGAITYTYEDGTVINFSRAEPIDCYINLNIVINRDVIIEGSQDENKLISSIKEAIINYVNNLGINNDILFSGVISAIHELNSSRGYEDFVFDITDLKIGNSSQSNTKKLEVDIYQFAQIDTDKITINSSYEG